MPYILGLTGNIASGKTTIGLMLLELGATVYVDADQVVHELYLPGRPLVERLAAVFGPQIIGPDGGIDRKTLGAIVFNDPEKLRLLEGITHPAVQQALVGQLRALPAEGVGVLDAIKLIEGGYAPLCHAVWLVRCPPEVQMRRLIEGRGLSDTEAQSRLAAQPPIEPKLPLVNEVIENNDSLDSLKMQVEAAWRRFSTQHAIPR